MSAKIVGGKKAPRGCEIFAFWHCKKCLESIPKGIAPKDWARLSVGWTKKGLQVWCTRHNMNVYDLDFLGQKVAVIPHAP